MLLSLNYSLTLYTLVFSDESVLRLTPVPLLPPSSYMAVTGLPQPQEDHAVRMVKFARDCMSRMARLLDDLSAQLGPDTRDLAMRVGLHRYIATVINLPPDFWRVELKLFMLYLVDY